MKIDRLLAIVMLLLHKEKISAQRLAEYFEVSVRTIQRDIDAISGAGIPVFANKGKNGGYSILENYKIDKNFLTAEEVNSLVSVLKGFTKTYESIKIKSIIEKVSGLMPDSDVDINRNKLVVDMTYWGNNKIIKTKINEINRALDESSVLSFDYTDINLKSTQRKVEPVSLVLKMNTWYLYAYCKYRQDFRLFKLSRMKNLSMCDEKSIEREMPVKLPWESSWQVESEKQRFVFKFNFKAVPKLEDYFDIDNISVNEDGSAIVTVNYPEDEWVYGMILSFGSHVEVLEPQHVREIIKGRAEEILKKYSK